MIKLSVTGLHPVTSSRTPNSDKTDESKKSNVTARTPERASVIGEAQQMLRQMPEVDEERVAELQQALANGELPLENSKLARSMLAFYRQ